MSRVVGLLVVLAIAWGGLAAAIATDTMPRLGLDLQGGTAVVLTAPEGTDSDLIDVSIGIMNNRIEDFGGVQEPEITPSGDDTVVVQLPGVEDEQRAIEAVGQTGELSFRPVLDAFSGGVGPLAGTNTPGVDNETGLTLEDDIHADAYLLYEIAEETYEVLYVGPAQLEGEHIAEAIPVPPGTHSIGSAVSLTLTSEGAQLFAELTGEAAKYPPADPRRQIAIVLDGAVVSSPAVNPDVQPGVGITGGSAVITMGGGQDPQQEKEEAEDLALVLRYGSLPVNFEVSAVQKVSATLGTDSLEAGLVAGLLGLGLVAIVLILIYRSLGMVAIVGLTVFASLLITLFGLFALWPGVTLTLAGVTGIIVSIGITTDSYIVYFERLKEKIHQGMEVDEAAAEGFRLAYRTIWAADTVSLLAALLLLWLAVGPVKGFAMALLVATILDLLLAPLYTKRAVALLAGTRVGRQGWFSIAGAAK